MFKPFIHTALITGVALLFSFATGCANDGSLEGSKATHYGWPLDELNNGDPLPFHAHWPFDSLDGVGGEVVSKTAWHWPFSEEDIAAFFEGELNWPFNHEYNEANDGLRLHWHWPFDQFEQLSQQDN